MNKVSAIAAAAFALAGCGGSDSTASSAPAAQAPAATSTAKERRETVFDPWLATMDRAKDVQKTLDEQAAQRRRQLEEAER
jgi:hypothetical protein